MDETDAKSAGANSKNSSITGRQAKCHQQPRKVTFVCLNAYPAFDKGSKKAIGGMETRAALLARALKRSSRWSVNFLLGNFGQPGEFLVDGVTLIKYDLLIERLEANVTRRFYKYRWRPVIHLDNRDIAFIWQFPLWLLFRMLPIHMVNRFWRGCKSDVVCCFGNNSTSASVIADCYRSGIKTILCIASDDDLSTDYKPDAKGRNDYGTPNWMAWYAIATADFVLTQTPHQQDLLRQRFQRQGLLLRNPVAVPAEAPANWPNWDERDFVLWVGRSDDFHKRPRLLIELARLCPECRFVMIVNRTNPVIYQELLDNCPPNVQIIESIPPSEIWNYLRRARMLVSTSAYEGFPNTFLQAAVVGTSVVSLEVDPEGMLSAQDCGLHARGDMTELAAMVRDLWNNEDKARGVALRMLDYVRKHHELEAQIARFADYLDEIVCSPDAGRINPWTTAPFQRFLPKQATKSG